MNPDQLEVYFELLNGVIGIAIFFVTLAVFKVTKTHPELIKSYFFLKSGNLSRPFFYLMIGMLIWGIREVYKVLELSGAVKIDLFYEVTEFLSVLFLLIGMLYIFDITKSKKER